MKRFYVLILALCSTLLVPNIASANDYLELDKHYNAYAAGMDKVHVKIPVWAYGKAYDYHATEEAYIFYKLAGEDTEHKIAYYKSDEYDENEKSSKKGTAYVKKAASDVGTLIVTSMASGVDYVVSNSWSEQLIVTQREDDNCDQVTFLEMDWYMPSSLDNKSFTFGVHWEIERSYHVWGRNHMSGTVTFNGFRGATQMLTPLLFDPYLYLVNEGGVVGYGYAGVPYSLFYTPTQYFTSLNASTVALTERSGNLYVMTTDTVQQQFYANFEVYRNEATGDKEWQQSTKVDIPPYHRIYNFTASEETDSTGTFTGNNILRWTIKNPKLKDIVEGDYFEVQRALKADFSDAKQLGMQQLVRDSIGIYTMQDNSREIWTGNAAVLTDTIDLRLTTQDPKFVVYDANNQPLAELNAKLTSDNLRLASVPVYYRIRRASSSVWGWETEFSREARMYKKNFLAPLAQAQEPYTKDADYQQNRKVNFRFRLENKEVKPMALKKDSCTLTYSLNKILKSGNVDVTIQFVQGRGCSSPANYTLFRVETEDGRLVQDWTSMSAGVHQFPYNSIVSVKTTDPNNYMVNRVQQVTVKGKGTITSETYWQMAVENITTRFAFEDDATMAEIASRAFTVKDSLFTLLQKENNIAYGRCMWDKSARLVLVRTLVETGLQTEFIIPQDSIRRLADGSWIATYSDIADQACMHYRYAVRIDQSKSDLRLQEESQLVPINISGPELYFDEGATITSFSVSQGDARGAMKRGVTLSWQPSSSAVDMYVLERKPVGSDAAADTLYQGAETAYFDLSAEPDKRYTYTISALYDCNGKHTNNARSLEGYRSKYGEISGSIVLSDNSGMNGVRVALQGPDGQEIKAVTTNATGAYKFDSLTYNIGGFTNYVVVPTHIYGQFAFNNTSMPTATISLSATNAVASDINFVNTSSARLTGRVLYQKSTVPVVGAMFLLNGDTIRRGSSPLKTGTDGNFEIIVPKSQPCVLQVIKEGHHFAGQGILQVEQGRDTFALTKPLDGVRFYDETTVRLVGRVAGGNDQKALPESFGLGRNNLGDDLQLVLQIEGDNTAHLVHDPNDDTRDTIHQNLQHFVWGGKTSQNPGTSRSVGETSTLFEKKRIIIRPDNTTGEFQVDLFPVKYKVVQATARGYATLFASGQGSETFDLTNAPLCEYTAVYSRLKDSVLVEGHTPEKPVSQRIAVPWNSQIFDGDSIHYNAVYDRIYHNPIRVELTQMIYGMERKGYGEPTMEAGTLNATKDVKVQLYNELPDGTIRYALGSPLFYSGRKYQFKAKAYEDYYYNNDSQTGTLNRVPWRGGSVTVRNGMHGPMEIAYYSLDKEGTNSNVWLMADDLDVETNGVGASRAVSVALETEGNVVETNVFRGFLVGTKVNEKELTATDADIQLLDIVRDPGGAGSSAYVESGTTYTFGFTNAVKAKFGLIFTPKWSQQISTDVGIITGLTTLPGSMTGQYAGSTYEASKSFALDIPVVFSYDYSTTSTYSLTTTDRISTSSSGTKSGVGSNADVFLGATVQQLAGKAKTIALINDSLYQARQPAILAGAMLVLAQGTDSLGKPYYLVTGEKMVLAAQLGTTFAYTQRYIFETLIPRLAIRRQNLLMQFADSAAAQQAADLQHKPVYWYHGDGTYLNDTLPHMTYDMFIPTGDKNVYVNEVDAIDNMLLKWVVLLAQNEREKIEARMTGQRVGTYSASFNTSYTHSQNLTSDFSYSEVPTGSMFASNGVKDGLGVLTSSLSSLFKNVIAGLKGDNFIGESAQTIGQTAAQSLQEYLKNKPGAEPDEDGNVEQVQKDFTEIGTKSSSSKFSIAITPVADLNWDRRSSTGKKMTKNAGFTIAADPMGDITVSVYRAKFDSTWLADTKDVRTAVGEEGTDNLKYGSYVFFTEAGASFCPHEAEERSKYYNKGTLLNNGTEWVAKPEMSANTYEVANVPASDRASFRIELRNNGMVDTGTANDGAGFYLTLEASSNPDGAKVYVNGAALAQSIYYWIAPGQPVIQTLEVERGTVDDYNLTLRLYCADCMKTNTNMNLGVHFMPVSTDVQITMPRQNWVMNTLSPSDSAGYYLPIDISGFNTHHKNFDHIEFQYKLSTQSDDDWVNQCSFYAEERLYEEATGNKAMIENGRIVPFRFYGERDPMEQKYDLRAVSFCRYGSGFVTKVSPVISGTKDTRPPRVFGAPEPANNILGVGDNLLLRFNEAIAGNYLDEDNNFQILGVTNETGINASTALHFDGHSFAGTKVKRDLSGKSYTIDMMIRPTEATGRKTDMLLLEYGNEFFNQQCLLTSDNRLKVIKVVDGTTLSWTSKPIGTILAFTRVLFVFDNQQQRMRFYAGSTDVTNNLLGDLNTTNFESSAEFHFGANYVGDMLETRIWTKALTLEEIAATADHYLTGYERELLAYYRMSEGRGETITDRAHGATLYLDGCSWNKQKGFSLNFDGTGQVMLNGNLMGRSAAYDETMMLWFKATAEGTLFSADRIEGTDSTAAVGTCIALENGQLALKSGNQSFLANGQFVNNEWHHLVLTVNRTFNNASLFLDGDLLLTVDAVRLEGITGTMYLGGNGFKGLIDEFAIMEQALPKTLVEAYFNTKPVGDEMGLMAYLPFEEMRLNPSGVMEQVFSINDQRQFRDANGKVINKVVPLVSSPIADRQKARENAPVSAHGQLTKLFFDWSFNQDELMINILNQDKEVNKQSIYLTVRDVEDLNGNPMASPVTWTAYMDRNSLKWDRRELSFERPYGVSESVNFYTDVSFTNHSGQRHQYTIESLPEWLSATPTYGSLDPTGYKSVRLTFDGNLPVGTYTDLIYLTDENGLSEPLYVEYIVEAYCPWNEVNADAYPNTMNLRGQVRIFDTDSTSVYDSSPDDAIAAFCNGEMVGLAYNSFDANTNKSFVYLTIHGNSDMTGKLLTFKLWRASTGKVFNLKPSTQQRYQNNAMRGYAPDSPVQLSTYSGETQQVELNKGWNWLSFYLKPQPDSLVSTIFTEDQRWSAGDLLKTPSGRQLAQYDGTTWKGTLNAIDYHQMYMAKVAEPVTVSIDGSVLSDAERTVTLYHDWSSIAYLLDEPMSVQDALADYLNNASEGDVIKSKTDVAVFSENRRWEGSLQTLRPGKGYLFRRLGKGTVTMTYYPKAANAPEQRELISPISSSYATNMTMVAKLTSPHNKEESERVLAYVDDELVAVAVPQVVNGDTLFFLTISSDNEGAPLRFTTTDGTPIRPISPIGPISPIRYRVNAHHGTIREPVILVPVDDLQPQKILENGMLYILMPDGTRYSATGKKVQ